MSHIFNHTKVTRYIVTELFRARTPCQRYCPFNAYCPSAIALAIALQVGKMWAVPRTFAPHFTRCHTRSPHPRRPAFYP